MKTGPDPRSLAIKSLLRIEKNGKYSNLEVDAAAESSGMTEADRRLYSRLVYGAIERKITLDAVAADFSRRPPEKLDPECRAALRVGLYQIMYSDRIPDHAAVNATVGAVGERYRGYVNGVLRSFLRKKDGYSLTFPGSKADNLSVRYSVSPDIAEVLIDSYGPDRAEMILSSFSGEAAVCLRLNTLRKPVLPEGARPASGPLDVIAAFVDSVSPKVRRGIAEGDWFVQDASSILCTEVLGAEPGETVADVCAAPGGKSFSSAMRMKNKGTVYSFDLHENKLSLIKIGAGRLGIEIIRTSCRDGREPLPDLFGKCERVLCDAPCSGIGVIGKKPEIRYKKKEDFEKLPAIQKELLAASASYAAPGGVLVYSTCTLNRKENEDVAEALVSSRPDFEPLDFELPGIGQSSGGMMTLFPSGSDFPRDGFFIARFRRRSE
ncbi:MAG: 16S rRNA (cytosine(967)-C(5))-methyltransferase RsmB [Clostridia bacterium]|nr:16S rRNA (cytosine(967)-C(5))-methyltransferase RsmB [Clostridia bacterium]